MCWWVTNPYILLHNMCTATALVPIKLGRYVSDSAIIRISLKCSCSYRKWNVPNHMNSHFYSLQFMNNIKIWCDYMVGPWKMFTRLKILWEFISVMQSYIVVLRHVIWFFLNVMFIYRRYRRTHFEYVKLGKPNILQRIIWMLWVFDCLSEVTVICIYACISCKSVAPSFLQWNKYTV
jgi:hypothetical protein